MKKSVLLLAVLLTAGCAVVTENGPVSSDPGLSSGVPGSVLAELTNDILLPDGSFNFNTIAQVRARVAMVSGSDNTPVGGARITVYDQDRRVAAFAYTAPSGVAEFTITIPSALDNAEIVLTHPDYSNYSITVSDISAYEKIDRTLSFSAPQRVAVVVRPDTDGDGVPDDEDEFPEDPRYAHSIKAEYTLAFEDLYPARGDADFNDGVVHLQLEERINGENGLAAILVTARALASGAGFNNQFAIRILGSNYLLIESYKSDLSNKWNSTTNAGDVSYVPSYFLRDLELQFEPALERVSVAPMPYDPFLIPDGAKAVRYDTNTGLPLEIHLPFVETDYSGMRLDSEGFPWAMIVPGDWLWPLERVFITNAYAGFQAWYESGGTQFQDWYSDPIAESVYNR